MAVNPAVNTTSPQEPKFFIQLSGSPGSGKSTLATHLAPPINAVIFSYDSVRSTLLASLPFDAAAKLTYEIGWTITHDLIEQDKNVIMDSTCNYQETLNRGEKVASEGGYEYWYVECLVKDEEVLDQRLRGRRAMRSQRTGVGSEGAPRGAGGKVVNRKPVRLRVLVNPNSDV